MIARLPAKGLHEVITRLSIDDAKSLYQATSRSKQDSLVTKSCLWRLSVKEYIQSHLGDASIILRAMYQNFVYLSGSRALEFFRPGSIGNQSDWDFYAPNDFDLVSDFMHEMERVGVIWHSPLDRIQKLMRESGGTVRLPYQAFCDVVASGALSQAATDKDFTIYDNPSNLDSRTRSQNVHIYTGDKTIIVDTGGIDDDYGDILRRVIRGELKTDMGKVEIQLMVEDRKHPFDTSSIFKFHSSAVQCYLSAHVACHYYGKEASPGITHVWHDHVKTQRKERALQKYRERGFREETLTSARGFQYRHADGSQATFLGGFNHIDTDPDLVRNYTEYARGITWIETLNITKLLGRDNCLQKLQVSPALESRNRAVKYPPHPVARLWAVKEKGKYADVTSAYEGLGDEDLEMIDIQPPS